MTSKRSLEHIRLACEIRATGISFKRVAEELEGICGVSYSPAAIWQWQKTPEWKAYAQELDKQRIESGMTRFDNYLTELEGATEDLKDLALENLRSAAIAQNKLAKMLQAVPDTLPIETIQDFALLLKVQNEVSKGVQLCWEALERAGRLSEFMADNSTVDIAFEAYEE